MNRFCYLVPNFNAIQAVAHDFEVGGVDKHHIFAVGRDHSRMANEDIQEADVTMTSELIPAMKKGAVMGVLIASAGLIIARFLVPVDMALPLGIYLLVGFLGLGFGVWVSGMIGISIENPIIEAHKKDISKGKYILMVDIPLDKESKLIKRMSKTHPEAKLLHGNRLH